MRSATARMLWDSADRILSQYEAPSDALDRAIFEAGLHLAFVPEADGGLGLPLADVAALARLWGFRAARRPIVEPLLAARVALASGLGLSWLTASFMLEGGGDAAWWPGAAGLIIMDQKGDVTAFTIDDPGVRRTRDLAGQWRVALPASARPVLTARVPDHVSIACAAYLLSAADLLGAMDKARDLALDHARLRRQFGSALIRFQAIQRLIAEAAAEIEATRALVEYALADFDTRGADQLISHIAKSRASQAATIVAAHVHQVIGAVGFTEEHELHRFTKRLWSGRDDGMRQRDQEEVIGRWVATTGGDGLWPLLAGT